MITSALLLSLIATAGPGAGEARTLERVNVSAHTLAALSLTAGRTQGGVGGGLGVSYALTRAWVVDAEAAWLVGVGSSTLLRVGGGWQRPGTWRPLFRLNLELGLGGSLDFSVQGQLPPVAPTLGLTVTAALVRFGVGPVNLSFFELTGGLATEWLSVGPRFSLELFTLSVPLAGLLD